MKLDRKNIEKILGIITFTIVLYTCLQNFDIVLSAFSYIWGITFPFILGGAIAFVINIPMSFFEKFVTKVVKHATTARAISLILALASFVAVLWIVMFLLIPELVRTGIAISKSVEEFIPVAIEWSEQIASDPLIGPYVANINIDWESVLGSITSFIQTSGTKWLSSSLTFAGSVFSGIVSTVIGIVFSFYVLVQKETLSSHANKILHALFHSKFINPIIEVLTLSNKTFRRFITGQCLEALILGSLFVVTMTILGLPYALLIGVIISVTALVPIVGAFLGCFIGILLLIINDPTQALIFVVLFLILQQVEGNLIYPHVVGSSVGLPSIWVLVAITIGGTLFGITGMLIFIPLVSVFYVLFRKFIYGRLKEKNITLD